MIPYRGVEQLAARRAHNPKVAGSNPAPATKILSADPQFAGFKMRAAGAAVLQAGVAQLVERILGKDKVTGSIPVTSSIYMAV
jgi:hypothetical protein